MVRAVGCIREDWGGGGGGVLRRVPAEPPSTHQPACKPGSVGRGLGPPRDGHSSATPVARRLRQPTRTAGSGHRSRSPPSRGPRRPYSVLLPVGFAVPPALPQARCALAAPFHPCRTPTRRMGARRSVFCGTFPRLAPAGRYPAPHVHGARTFLSSPPFGIGSSGRPSRVPP